MTGINDFFVYLVYTKFCHGLKLLIKKTYILFVSSK